jgi:hypothetical protein
VDCHASSGHWLAKGIAGPPFNQLAQPFGYYAGKEVGQAFQPDKAQSQAGKPDLQCVSFVPG